MVGSYTGTSVLTVSFICFDCQLCQRKLYGIRFVEQLDVA